MPTWERIWLEATMVLVVVAGVVMATSERGVPDGSVFAVIGVMIVVFGVWGVWRWAICGVVRIEGDRVTVLGQARSWHLERAEITHVDIEPSPGALYGRVVPVLHRRSGRKIRLTEFSSPARRYARDPDACVAVRTCRSLSSALDLSATASE